MKAKETLEQLQQDIKDKAERLLVDVEVKQGTLKDQGARVVLEVSETALTTAADFAAKLGRLEKPVDALRGEAKKLKDRQDALLRPAVDEYDDLNVKSIAALMDDLGAYDLKKIQTYEKSHKNRKTILREVDRRLAS